MKQIDRAVITEFSKPVDLTPFQNSYDLIVQHLRTAIDVIKQRNPYITDYKIYVANEVFSGTEFFASSIDLFVVFNAVQIELNYNDRPKKKFTKNIQYFWKEFKSYFNLFSSKKKKSEKLIKETEKRVLSLKDYNVEVLYNDLFVNLTKVLYKTSSIQLNGSKLVVVGNEEFGIDINIYPVFETYEGLYKLYNIYSQNNYIIDFKERFDNVYIKNIKTSEQFTNQIRIFNNLYWNILKQKPNQIFIESILFSCPDNLFTNDKVETTINLLNYLKNSAMQNIASICDTNSKLFTDNLNSTSLDLAIKFINNIQIV